MATLTISLDDDVVVKAEVDIDKLRELLGAGASPQATAGFPRSKPINVAQARELLSRINDSSATFLREVAAKGGSVTWGQMRTIFGINDPEDFTPFTNGFGRGITRALRHITGDSGAVLFWWEDPWPEGKSKQDSGHVYIDGPALEALRHA